MACVDVNCFGRSNKFLGSVSTVDGCFEFQEGMAGRNPANQLMWRIYHYLQGFIHLRWLFGISEPSTVPIVVMLVKLTSPSLLHHFCSALEGSPLANIFPHGPRTLVQAVPRQKPALQKIQKHFSDQN